jgi:hypothetical protein
MQYPLNPFLLTRALTGGDGSKEPGGDMDGSSGVDEGSALCKDGFAHKLISSWCAEFSSHSQPARPPGVLMSQ